MTGDGVATRVGDGWQGRVRTPSPAAIPYLLRLNGEHRLEAVKDERVKDYEIDPGFKLEVRTRKGSEARSPLYSL